MPSGDGVGEVYKGECLRPDRVFVQPATIITPSGCEPITLIEFEVTYQGVPFRFAIELPRNAGYRLGESLMRKCAPVAEPVRTHDEVGQCLCLGVDLCGTAWCVDPEHQQ